MYSPFTLEYNLDLTPLFHAMELKDSNSRVHEMEKEASIPHSPRQNSPHKAHLVPFSPQTTPSRQSTESIWSPLHRPLLFHHCVTSLHCHKNSVNAIAVMRSRLVLTGSNSSRIRAWRRFDCMDVGYIQASSGGVRCMLARGDMLFTSHKDRKIRVWDIGARSNGRFNPKKMMNLPKSSSNFHLFTRTSVQHQHKDDISCMAYYNIEGILYTGSWDRTIKAWRVSDQKCIDSFVAHEDNINALVVNQEDGCVFTASSDGTVKIWRRAYGGFSHSLTMTLKFQLSPVNALALSVSPKGSLLYSGSSDGYTNFWVKEKLSCRYNHCGFLEGHMFGVLCLLAVDNLVISGSEDTTIRVWRREEGSRYHECLVILEGHKGPVKCLNACLEMDNQKVVKALSIYSASLDQTFKVWRVNVLPESGASGFDDSKYTDDDVSVGWKSKSIEFEMSPVLSPVWVEKKLQLGM